MRRRHGADENTHGIGGKKVLDRPQRAAPRFQDAKLRKKCHNCRNPEIRRVNVEGFAQGDFGGTGNELRRETIGV